MRLGLWRPLLHVRRLGDGGDAVSDQVWIVVSGAGHAFTATRSGNVFTLVDALTHIWFGPWDEVGIVKRSDKDAQQPGAWSGGYELEMCRVKLVNRVLGLIELEPLGC